jgi:hypothetical protein
VRFPEKAARNGTQMDPRLCGKPGDAQEASSPYAATRTPPTSITLAPSKQAFAHPTLMEEHACPDNRENGTQLKERCHIPDEAERNRREAKERSDTGEQDGGGERTRVGAEPLPGSLGARRLLRSG